MNGDRRKFWRQAEKPLLAAGCALLLGACAQLPQDGLFAEVANPGPYPVIADIPAAPTDVRSLAAWRSDAAALIETRQTLEAETAPSTFELNDTDAFAARIIAQADVQLGDVPTQAQTAATEAFARMLRERATPPPRPR